MGYSSLAKSAIIADSGNYKKGRDGNTISVFTPHHMVAVWTGEQCATYFQRPGLKASANYCIGNDGGIVCNVQEEDRAYTSSSYSNDVRAITVEVANSSLAPNYEISEAAFNSLINLAVDVCRRYNFRLNFTGDKNGSLTAHRMFASTSCCGPYLYGKLPELQQRVNEILDGTQPTPQPVPTPVYGYKIGDVVNINGVYTSSNSTNKLNPAKSSGTITKIITGALNPYLLDNGNLGWVNDSVIVNGSQPAPAPVLKSVSEIADEVIAGKWGNGSDRQKNLENAGYNYAEVQAEVNRKLGASTPTQTKSIDEVAKEVIRGEWGNGQDRINRLTNAGYDANAVQKRVNEML